MNTTLRSKQQKLNFIEKLYIPEIVSGMALTLKYFFKPKITRQYPEEKWDPKGSYRGSPVLVEENGKERCVACGLCSRVCPALAIEVQAAETADEKERYPIKFEINLLRCIYCGYCEEVCPEEAIVMSKQYEWTFSDFQKGILSKEQLLTPVEKLQDKIAFLITYRNK